jgi:hypothetical protein
MGGVEAARMGAERHLGQRDHAVGRDLDQVGPGPDVVDDAFDGDDRAAPCSQRAPHPFEQWRAERHVARPVGQGGMNQGDVRGVGGEEAHPAAERRLDDGEPVVRLHRRSLQ